MNSYRICIYYPIPRCSIPYFIFSLGDPLNGCTDCSLQHVVIVEERDQRKREEIAQEISHVPLNDGSMAEVITYEPERVEIRVKMENAGFLVLGDTYYPGWEAVVKGQKEKILPADHIIRAVFLEKGEHEVRFLYDPASFRIGMLLSIGALTAIMILWWRKSAI